MIWSVSMTLSFVFGIALSLTGTETPTNKERSSRVAVACVSLGFDTGHLKSQLDYLQPLSHSGKLLGPPVTWKPARNILSPKG